MLRASLVVALKSGIYMDANHLSISRAPYPASGQPGPASNSVVSFISSGARYTYAPEEIVSITLAPSGAHFCGECDGSLYHVIGPADIDPDDSPESGPHG